MIIHAQNICKKFKQKMIFDQLNLTIEEPDIYGLVAPNGYGKTTLLNILSGLSQFSGEVTLLGKSRNEIDVKEFSYLQGNEGLYDYLSGYDHLYFLCKRHQLDPRNIETYTELLAMQSYIKQKTSTYSLGMKQRLLLALAMIKEPKLIFLDEPFNGLDPTSMMIIREVLFQLKENGTTLLISSHDLSELDRLTKKIFFIQDQQLVFELLEESTTDQLAIHVTIDSLAKMTDYLTTHAIPFKQQENLFEVQAAAYDNMELLGQLLAENIRIETFTNKKIVTETLYQEKYGKD